MPNVTLVTGTYNRLSALRAMIDSARVAAGCIPLDFVIVDGGSTDGTLDYLRQQSDVTLIEHGELRGAIKAFCEGARAATGDYVIMANDDIQFHPNSIIKAFAYLESHSSCGAVAFQDNRPAVDGGSTQYKAQLQVALSPDGSGCSVVYAQVGMFRRWLGDMVGWWGDLDPCMSQARTYGGDNWLSSKVWELGYSVEIVGGVIVHDYILQDGLRQYNSEFHDSAYYKCYPRGPQVATEPQVDNPQKERLRILYLPIYEPGVKRQKQTKRGLRLALQKVGIVCEVDYLNEPQDIPALVEVLQPHLMLTQLHDAHNSLAASLPECRRRKPDMVVVNWHGDARGLTDSDYLDLLKHVDLQLVVNAAALPIYEALGIRASYWQIGYEETSETLPDVAKHDVVFLANCYNEARREIEQALLSTGLNVGFYGLNWQQPSGECLYDFDTGAALMENAKIVISDTFSDGKTPIEGFVSNRLFQALAAGAFVLQQKCPGLDLWTGIEAGVHYIEWTDTEDLKSKLEYWMKPAQATKRKKISKAGHRIVYDRYSFEDQVFYLFERILPQLQEDAHATA